MSKKKTEFKPNKYLITPRWAINKGKLKSELGIISCGSLKINKIR